MKTKKWLLIQAVVAGSFVANFGGALSFAAHPLLNQIGVRGGKMDNRIYLQSSVAGSISTTAEPVNGRYLNLPPFSAEATCRGCHVNIFTYDTKNRHAALGYDKLTGRLVTDPARPWVQGPGKFGKWCSGSNRQLADLKASFTNPATDPADFLSKVDLGVYEWIKECGICHVGDGPAVKNPYTNLPVYTNLNAPKATAWSHYVREGMVTSAPWITGDGTFTFRKLELDCLICHLDGYDHIVRNEQIAQYEEFQNAVTAGSLFAKFNGDPISLLSFDYDNSFVSKDPATNALYLNDSAMLRITRSPKAGNCAGCHMPTALPNTRLDWKKGFYASDAVPGATPVSPNKVPARFLSDFVKRGDTWAGGDDFHYAFDCGGCHNQTGKFQAYDPLNLVDKRIYIHSPGKGYDNMLTAYPEYNGTVKMCTDCHVKNGDLNGDGNPDMATYTAPNPMAGHILAGLEAKIVPTARRLNPITGAEETFQGSHIDIFSCTACHVNKQYAAGKSYDFSTGTEFVNFTGNPDASVPVVDSVPLAFTWKENENKKTADNKINVDWRRQIYAYNYLTAISWNNIGTTVDVNGDGIKPGQLNQNVQVWADPFFNRNIKARFSYGSVNSKNNLVPDGLIGVPALDSKDKWAMLNQEGGVTFTQPSEIDAFQAAMGQAFPGSKPQLMLEAEPYLLTHNIMSHSLALGKIKQITDGKVAQYGCDDCHGSNQGVFNGSYDLIGKGKKTSDGSESQLAITWNDVDDVKAKAMYWDRDGKTLYLDFTSGNSTRNPMRYELLGFSPSRVTYLNSLTNPADFGIGVPPAAKINPIADIDTAKAGIQVALNTAIALSAKPGDGDLDSNPATTKGYFSYEWEFSDSTTAVNGQNISKTFSTAGNKTIVLRVVDEEGKTAQDYVNVEVVTPSTITISAVTAGSVTTVTFGTLPQPNAKLYIVWGDGSTQWIATKDTANPDGVTAKSVGHSYAASGSKTVTVSVYDSTGKKVGYKQQVINVP